MTFLSPPPKVADTLVAFPGPHVLLVTLNRPTRLNAIHAEQHRDLDRLWRWFDAEPSLRCAIITGSGRAFCAGADLAQWNDRTNAGNIPDTQKEGLEIFNTPGFGGLSNRTGKKPIIAAVNGLCLGGGMEMVINCDLVVAGSRGAKFGLPEVKRGVVALAGALPRLIRTVGKQRASEMALLGRMYGPDEMKDWGLVNFVVEGGNEGGVVAEAVRLATEISANSPDSVITTREGLTLGWEGMGPMQSTNIVGKGLYARMDGAENMKEGLASFMEKRDPVWKDSKL
ncbi:related to enoyl-CoA hydratase [Cephalotrichum gorgonifer]|uniref:Related to enoyl-CoA hydratase n=1 Tax=Cephalotrichum gorgonifer TaxID=2041049 RepID=A0AAE8SZG0_9PEZI|nr:related to enoyl-CoA hydratase [Cephalotrichum gorgonifer]